MGKSIKLVLFRDYLKPLSRLFETCSETILKLFTGYLKVIGKLSGDYLKAFWRKDYYETILRLFEVPKGYLSLFGAY